MGKEIVYCGDCGKSLREDDFARGKAQHLDHRPFCTECMPLAAAPPPQVQTSSKLSAMKVSTGRYSPPPAPSTRRRPAAEGDSSRTSLLVGAGLVVAAIVILLVFALSSGGRQTPEVPPPPAPIVGPPKPAPKASPAPAPSTNPDKAAAAIKELEAVAAASSPPIAVLQKCDEIRPLVAGTPHEARLKAIEEKAREGRRLQQLDASLEEVKKLRALDPAYERKEEIVRLLNATLPMSGSRRGEVEETLRNYQRDAQAYVPPAPLPAAAAAKPATPPVVAAPSGGQRLGPYETDATGCVNNWLVLGPFNSRADIQGLYDNDLLGPEAKHLPAAGREVAARDGSKLRWTPAVVTDGRLYFRRVLDPALKPDAPAIAFAACWIEADRDVEVKFKMHAEAGYYLFMDHVRVRNQPGGHMFHEEEDVVRWKLTKGPHLLLFKVAAKGAPFAVRLKLTMNDGTRMPGLRIWNQPPETRTVLYSQSFNAELDGFKDGTLADGGVNGTKALLIANAAGKDDLFKSPLTSETTIRFKVKLLTDVRSFQVMMWSNKVRLNYWYHVRNLPKGEWTTVEFKLAESRAGYRMEGVAAEGDLPTNLKFFAEPLTDGADSRALVDDVEILE